MNGFQDSAFDNASNYLTFAGILVAGGFALYVHVASISRADTVGDSAENKAMFVLAKYYNLFASLMFCFLSGSLIAILSVFGADSRVESYPLLLSLSLIGFVACAVMSAIRGQMEYNRLLSIERISLENRRLIELQGKLRVPEIGGFPTWMLLIRVVWFPCFLMVLLGFRSVFFQFETSHEALPFGSYCLGLAVTIAVSLSFCVFMFSIISRLKWLSIVARIVLFAQTLLVNLLMSAFLAQVQVDWLSPAWRLWNWLTWLGILSIPLIFFIASPRARRIFGQVRFNQIVSLIKINVDSINRTRQSLEKVSGATSSAPPPRPHRRGSCGAGSCPNSSSAARR